MFKNNSKYLGLDSRKAETPRTDQERPLEMPICEIPQENAPMKKKLDSPEYLMTHPSLMRKAYCRTIIKSAVQIILFLSVLGYVFAEVRSFFYLLSNYGFLRLVAPG